jgi:hypothetical protein
MPPHPLGHHPWTCGCHGREFTHGHPQASLGPDHDVWFQFDFALTARERHAKWLQNCRYAETRLHDRERIADAEILAGWQTFPAPGK